MLTGDRSPVTYRQEVVQVHKLLDQVYLFVVPDGGIRRMSSRAPLQTSPRRIRLDDLLLRLRRTHPGQSVLVESREHDTPVHPMNARSGSHQGVTRVQLHLLDSAHGSSSGSDGCPCPAICPRGSSRAKSRPRRRRPHDRRVIALSGPYRTRRPGPGLSMFPGKSRSTRIRFIRVSEACARTIPPYASMLEAGGVFVLILLRSGRNAVQSRLRGGYHLLGEF